MSVIFIGWDTTLNRKVAIKVLNEEYCNDEIRIQAFENEARLTAKVSHTNVVKIFAVDRAHGRFYLVMELLDGRSFERIMGERGALPEDEVLEIAIQITSGLKAAKRAGIIHRDVKPGNIHIAPEGRASLLDFGLALITQDGKAQAKEAWATPYYVPPEALDRDIEDFRSDIYAFGATLYHALAGCPPFKSATNSISSLRKAKQAIPKLCKVAPWISRNTGEVIDRMMAFNPDHRWSSYSKVIKALEQAKLTIGHDFSPPIYTQARIKRRKRKMILSIISTVLLILVSIGLATWKPWMKITRDSEQLFETNDSQNKKPKIFNPNGDDRPSIAKRWAEARQLTKSGNYEKASERFLSISRDPTVSGMEQVWTSLEASIANALAGKPGAARRLISKSLSDLEDLPEQHSQQKRYRELCQLLERIKPPTTNDLPDEPKNITDWMGTFAIALKLWGQGKWEEALPLFSNVRGAELPDELSWFVIYQNIADVYLGDGQILARLKNFPTPKDQQEANSLIGEITNASKNLRSIGRAKYNLDARLTHLIQLRKEFQNSPVFTHSLTWKKFQAHLRNKGSSYRFDDIGALLQNPPEDAPSEAIWAWSYLQRNAAAFLNNITIHNNWITEKKNGEQITGVSGDSSGLKLEDGSVVPWSEIKPEHLLDKRANEEAQAIAFAWFVGLNEQAEKMAEDLAGRNPEFKTNWRRVIVGTSQ
jgi:serine/threonine protein kinase